MEKKYAAQHRGRDGSVYVFGTGLFSLAFPLWGCYAAV